MEFSSYFGDLHRLHSLQDLKTGAESFAVLQSILMLSAICFEICFLQHFIYFASQSAFFHQHGCTTYDTNAKYNSRAAQLYKEKIKSLATQATRKHGTDVSHVCLLSFRFLKHFPFLYHQSHLKFLIYNVKDNYFGGTATHCFEEARSGVSNLQQIPRVEMNLMFQNHFWVTQNINCIIWSNLQELQVETRYSSKWELLCFTDVLQNCICAVAQ